MYQAKTVKKKKKVSKRTDVTIKGTHCTAVLLHSMITASNGVSVICT